MEPSETELMLKGYGLTTAEFTYYMPDHVHVLNTYVWQDYDLMPDHPKLFKFIEFWQREIEGALHSVRFCHRKMISSGQWRNVKGILRLH
ncbi:aspartate-semialdehyde dehydrogenase [Sedimentitalea sp. CY04]|uniref:Aspartate-semialdehyde dehydrogenase n=1 Tax=Parasedimentitalea denitrificans TaxID=2211118 RepID=A0ABX0W607_9RHOB|nr:usg protein [Sedimentitalea sp. CY04]NIZ60861.1 aspartate-semialdehyde dehydrogenase [Sedimentitalea sp. CY04]